MRCMVHGRIYIPRSSRSERRLGSIPSTASMRGTQAGRLDRSYKPAKRSSILRPRTKAPEVPTLAVALRKANRITLQLKL